MLLLLVLVACGQPGIIPDPIDVVFTGPDSTEMYVDGLYMGMLPRSQTILSNYPNVVEMRGPWGRVVWVMLFSKPLKHLHFGVCDTVDVGMDIGLPPEYLLLHD